MMLLNFVSIMQNTFVRIIPFLFGYLLLMSIIYLYKLFRTKDALKAWYKKRLLVSGLSMVGIILLWALIGLTGSVMGVGQGGMAPIPMAPINSNSPYSGNVSGKMMPDFYQNNYNNYGGNNGNISDTREFIKKTFSATLKTREVESTSKKVEVLIKGMEGRIDSANISTQYGYFSFVIPKSKLDEFETQLRSYTNVKFYSQQVSSQNLLGEKQNLERNQGSTIDTISTLTAQQKQLSDEYAKNLASIKTELATQNAQLKTVQANILRKQTDFATATDTVVKIDLTNQLSNLRQSEQNLKQSILVVNSNITNLTNTFKSQMTNLGFSLDQQNNTLANLGAQENNFFDNIETVNGNISINYISIWEVLDIYSPVNPFIILIVAFFGIRMFFLVKKERELSLLAVTV